ncbi:hypothetical protein pdam_00002470, partial [Pocillopora damicornis]
VHAVEASKVSDHCRIYALSDPSNAEFRGSCDHLHNEPYEQCGKGVCDRKAATIKGRYVGRYVNEGNDIINALQFKTAIESGQETTGKKASYVAAKPSNTFNIKWDGISLLNNFEYDESDT